METSPFLFQVSGVEFVDSSTLFVLDAELPDLPSYLRIGCVGIEFDDDDYLDDEEFQEFMPLFHQLKPALIGSHLIMDTDSQELIKKFLTAPTLKP